MFQTGENLFEQQIGRGALIGGVLGLVGVFIGFVMFVLVTGEDRTVIGVAALAAPFGGAGFGAMIGAVLGAIRAAEIEAAAQRAKSVSIQER